MKRLINLFATLGLTAGSLAGQEFTEEIPELRVPDPLASRTVEELDKQVKGLRAEKPKWRQISWGTSLARGLAESRKSKKPVFLWIFIDRPVDDKRC